jgi:hypothetical protein
MEEKGSQQNNLQANQLWEGWNHRQLQWTEQCHDRKVLSISILLLRDKW